MIGMKETTIAVCFFALGLAASNVPPGAQAHGPNLTRFDIQQAMREAMRTQKQPSLSRTDIAQAVRGGVNGCRFKGQNTDQDTAEEADATDFQGQIAC